MYRVASSRGGGEAGPGSKCEAGCEVVGRECGFMSLLSSARFKRSRVGPFEHEQAQPMVKANARWHTRKHVLGVDLWQVPWQDSALGRLELWLEIDSSTFPLTPERKEGDFVIFKI
jgi:hypothetical protein